MSGNIEQLTTGAHFDNFMEQILQEISRGRPRQDFGQMNSARSEREFPEILTLSFNQRRYDLQSKFGYGRKKLNFSERDTKDHVLVVSLTGHGTLTVGTMDGFNIITSS